LMKERQEKDKDSKVDYGYLASIIDKIF